MFDHQVHHIPLQEPHNLDQAVDILADLEGVHILHLAAHILLEHRTHPELVEHQGSHLELVGSLPGQVGRGNHLELLDNLPSVAGVVDQDIHLLLVQVGMVGHMAAARAINNTNIQCVR